LGKSVQEDLTVEVGSEGDAIGELERIMVLDKSIFNLHLSCKESLPTSTTLLSHNISQFYECLIRVCFIHAPSNFTC